MNNDIINTQGSDLEQTQHEETILATRKSRFIATIIDALTVIPVTIPLAYFTGGFDVIKEGVKPPLEYTLMMLAIGIILFLILHGKIMLRDGQTWGKRFQNIKMVKLDDSDVTMTVLIKRYSFYWFVSYVPFVGSIINAVNVLFIFGKSKRCLHDYIAGTKVIQTKKQK